MSTNSSEVHTCPTTPGSSREGGFNPWLSWSSLASDPTGNWHIIGWMVCIGFLAVTWIVTLKTMYDHFRNYYEPQIQRHKLRVILFPPIYATLSWFEYFRYDYATTIHFFATVFEAFAVFKLYNCLQAYLKPYRQEAGDLKEPKDTKVLFRYELHIKSKWGMHYRTLTDILVFQYPIWSILSSLISIFTELSGHYCKGVYSFRGAYIYLTIINFVSLIAILGALFTYLDVFHNEWKRGNIRAHGMFWCVKGPIMVNFLLGHILLSILTSIGIIKGTDGSNGGIAWSADAVKDALYVIIICITMMVDSVMMYKFFGPQDNIRNAANAGQAKRMSGWKAFADGYLSYFPELFRMFANCGTDSLKLMQKRRELNKRKEMKGVSRNEPNAGTDRLLDDQNNRHEEDTEYKMADSNHTYPLGQDNPVSYTSPQHGMNLPYSQPSTTFPEPQYTPYRQDQNYYQPR